MLVFGVSVLGASYLVAAELRHLRVALNVYHVTMTTSVPASVVLQRYPKVFLLITGLRTERCGNI